MARGHIIASVSGGLTFGHLAGWPPGPTFVAAAFAPLTSAGITSPDMDHWFHAGEHGPFRHRGITHWPGTALVAAIAILATVHGPMSVIAWGLWSGWASHLAADALFGKAYVRGNDGERVRGPGIPWAPWWGHWGLGLDVDGWLERRLVTPLVLPALAAYLFVLVTLGGTP